MFTHSHVCLRHGTPDRQELKLGVAATLWSTSHLSPYLNCFSALTPFALHYFLDTPSTSNPSSVALPANLPEYVPPLFAVVLCQPSHTAVVGIHVIACTPDQSE